MAELITPGGGGGAEEEQPKIVVDSDWKAQAEAEREKLAEQEAEAAAQGQGVGADGIPPADFRGLMSMLVSQAIMYMGAMPDEQGRAVVVPEYAKHHIDLLEILQAKTKGNLTEEEDKELEAVLHELRMRFVQIMGLAAEQQASGQGGAPTEEPNAGG